MNALEQQRRFFLFGLAGPRHQPSIADFAEQKGPENGFIFFDLKDPGDELMQQATLKWK